MANIKSLVEQFSPTVGSEGVQGYAGMSKTRQLWTADWKYKLIAAGKAYRMSFGTISGGTDIVLGGDATGGIDLDQPEGIVSVNSDVLVPMELQISGVADLDALNDDVQILLTVDRATAVTSATATTETPDNLLDGGPAFGGSAFSLVTSDITDPVHNDVLFFKIFNNMIAEGTASNVGPVLSDFSVHKDFTYPVFLAGPCSLLLYAAGEVAYTFAGSITFAHIPRTWIPTS